MSDEVRRVRFTQSHGCDPSAAGPSNLHPAKMQAAQRLSRMRASVQLSPIYRGIMPHIPVVPGARNLVNGPLVRRRSEGELLQRENTNPIFFSRTLSSESTYRSHIQDLIFDLYREENDKIYVPKFFKQLFESGIRKDDPRLELMIKTLKETEDKSDVLEHDSLFLDRDQFKRCVGNAIGVIAKALKNQLVIPDWQLFTKIIGDIFEETRQHNQGNVATYIPQLARACPSSWGLSICTIDGQRRSWGDSTLPFCMQSVSKPFTYAFVHDDMGPDELHFHVGQEPSGRLFNDISLDHNKSMHYDHEAVKSIRKKHCTHPKKKKPHNPLINAGAIVVSSLMKRHATLSDRFDFALRQFRKLAGNGYVGFNNAVFLSERETADRNYALSYYMREHKVFPPDTNLQDTLDLYFQLCSIETNADSMAVMAATLANGGVNPLTGDRIINNRACRDTLSLMYSCGMYDWSGQFAFRIGLPAKSGVSGDMIIVIPNVMGICLYSPRLDSLGNTVRGVKFAEALIQKFNFHNYDSLVYSDSQKLDPRKTAVESEQDNTSKYMYAAKIGDIAAIKRYLLLGLNIHDRDYDERTVLHVAAAQGDAMVLDYILSKWREHPNPPDRFGRTPIEDAMFFNHEKCVELLKSQVSKHTINEHPAMQSGGRTP